MSARLQAIKQMVTPGIPLVDIGSDHLILPNMLIDEGIVSSVIATDIHDGPIEIMKANRGDRPIQIIQSDGLKQMDAPVRASVIAGMGGHLIRKILLDSRERFEQMEYIIVQPVQHVEALRYFLMHHYTIVKESILFDEKWYQVLKIVPGADHSYDVLLTKGLSEDKAQLEAYLTMQQKREEKLYRQIPTAKRLYHLDRLIRLQQRIMI